MSYPSLVSSRLGLTLITVALVGATAVANSDLLSSGQIDKVLALNETHLHALTQFMLTLLVGGMGFVLYRLFFSKSSIAADKANFVMAKPEMQEALEGIVGLRNQIESVRLASVALHEQGRHLQEIKRQLLEQVVKREQEIIDRLEQHVNQIERHADQRFNRLFDSLQQHMLIVERQLEKGREH